jgi:hypothetical protein
VAPPDAKYDEIESNEATLVDALADLIARCLTCTAENRDVRCLTFERTTRGIEYGRSEI